MKTNITKSRAGHYTVTVRDGSRVIYREGLISSLCRAQQIACENNPDAKTTAAMVWKRTVEGYEAVGQHGTYQVERRGRTWVLFDDGEEYGEPGTLSGRKEVAQMLDDDRVRRVGGKPLIEIL